MQELGEEGFNRFRLDWAEAERNVKLLKESIKRLTVDEPDDEMVPLTEYDAVGPP